MLVLGHKMNNCEQLSSGNAVVELCFSQHLDSKGYNFLLSILDLREEGTNPFITGITVQHKLLLGLWMHQDQSLAQQLFQVLEHLSLLLVPLERSVLFCQLDQGFCFTKMRDESSIIAEKILCDFMDALWCWAFSYLLDFESVLILCSMTMCPRNATCF